LPKEVTWRAKNNEEGSKLCELLHKESFFGMKRQCIEH